MIDVDVTACLSTVALPGRAGDAAGERAAGPTRADITVWWLDQALGIPLSGVLRQEVDALVLGNQE